MKATGPTALDVHQTSDEQLAEQAAREDSDGVAFAALVDRYRERVWRICYRLMGNEHDASDAAQEVFVRLFVNRDKFAGRSKFGTWLHGIALRTCLTLRRSRSRRARHETTAATTPIEPTAPRQHTEPPSLAIDLMRMLDTLDEEDRAMLILKYAENYTFEELAEMFNLSPSACKMRAARARERLQRQFGTPESESTENGT